MLILAILPWGSRQLKPFTLGVTLPDGSVGGGKDVRRSWFLTEHVGGSVSSA